MAKSQTQLSREHVARIRRKAKAYDNLMIQLKAVISIQRDAVSETLRPLVKEAEKAVQE
jgi:hypothetical protein